MNAFILDDDPKLAAQYHCDKHCVKMILETAQLLCSVFHLQGIEAPYRLTHKNHPCSVWARESKENFLWLCELGDALDEEYTNRYGKIHKSGLIIDWCKNNINKLSFPQDEMTPFAQAMPDDCMHPDAVHAYRTYYMQEKRHIAQWKNETPYWYK